LSTREDISCGYCKSTFFIQYENNNAELTFCPFCGEDIQDNAPDYDDEEEDEY